MIDVWCLLDHAFAPHALDEAEHARAARLLCPRSAATYRAAHTLKRRVLSHYRPDVSPADWRFLANAWGKPAVAGLAAAPSFNLSHSGDAIAIAVAGTDIGVDIERVRPLRHPQEVARHVFHPQELAWLAAQPESMRAFFRLWTLKEALLKAAGTGFSHPARQLAWHGLDDPWAVAEFGGRAWVGATLAIGPETIIAIAVPQGSDLREARLLRLPSTGLHPAGTLLPQACAFVREPHTLPA
jgi:phosphopantetheinyl transferase